MASSDERRAVAKALLGDPMVTAIPKTRDGFDWMTYHEAAYRFWDMCRRVRSAAKVDIANSTTSVLADLIDPTCRAVHQGTSMDDELVCSECGASLEVEVDDEQRFIPKYCSCCGARVVSGDA